jgi:hypothetical protein
MGVAFRQNSRHIDGEAQAAASTTGAVDLLNAFGDGAAAEQNYHRALSAARPQGARIFELRAATSLARLWRRGDSRPHADPLACCTARRDIEGGDLDRPATLSIVSHDQQGR